MKLVLTKKEAVERLRTHLKAQEVGGGFFRLTTMDQILGRALESASCREIEEVIKDLGGVGRVFSIQGDLELSITA